MKLSAINPLAARGIVKDVDLDVARTGDFYRRAESFPEATVEVLVEMPPSQRRWMRDAKADAARTARKRRRAALRDLRDHVRLMPRLSERQRRLVARQTGGGGR